MPFDPEGGVMWTTPLDAHPVPCTRNFDPTGPDEGAMDTDGSGHADGRGAERTLKLPVTCRCPVVSVKLSVYVPGALSATVKFCFQVPLELTCQEDLPVKNPFDGR